MRLRSIKPLIFISIIVLMTVFVLFDNIEFKTKQIHTSLEQLNTVIPEYYQSLQSYLEKHPKLSQEKTKEVIVAVKLLQQKDIEASLHSQELADEYAKAFNDYQLRLNSLWESVALDSELLTDPDERKELYQVFVQSQRFHQQMDSLSAKLSSYNQWLHERKYSFINRLFHARELGPALQIDTYPIQLTSLKWPKVENTQLTEE